MSRTTGPILTIGAITFANQLVLPAARHANDPGIADDFAVGTRIAVATGAAALAFSGMERVWPDGALAVSWLALVAVLITRLGGEPAPVERALAFWNATSPYARR